jgi:hypothetical protein
MDSFKRLKPKVNCRDPRAPEGTAQIWISCAGAAPAFLSQTRS